jgi:acyl-CoA synthetase (AMP-forming)/AMP-acid ligase II
MRFYMSDRTTVDRWKLRTVPQDLVAQYREHGWWTDTTLGAVTAAASARAGRSKFRVYSSDRPWQGTCAEVDRRARSLAAALQHDGVRPGDVVVLQLPNWTEAAVAFWAALYLGAVVVPVVHFYGAKEIDYILRAVTPDVVVTPDRFRTIDYLSTYEALLSAHPQTRWVVAAEEGTAALPAGATPIQRLYDTAPVETAASVDPDAPAIVAFTSGTTSDPKGVVHTHRTIGAELLQMSGGALGGDAPAILTGAPVGHFIGMLSAFLRPLMQESGVDLIDVWDPGVVLRLMLEEGLMFAGGATYFLTSLLDHPDFTTDHLRFMPVCGLGGSAVPVAVTERAAALGIRVFRSYGATEHPSVTRSAPTDPEDKRLRTDGCPSEGVELRLDEDGQIWTRGPDLFMGYTNAELTGKVVDADGWYGTGDIGVLDGDGYLTITDRLSDVIIRGGENISAQEIEELLLRMKGLTDAAVVAAPDTRFGEHAAAVVTVRDEATQLTLEDVRSHLQQSGLGRQKWPESLYVVRDLPRTASGKVQKYLLRQQLRDGQLQELQQPPAKA